VLEGDDDGHDIVAGSIGVNPDATLHAGSR
jgi:hypothetical protein